MADLEPRPDQPPSRPPRDVDAKQQARWQQVHERAMKRWKLVEQAEAQQRQQELEDLKFNRARIEDHWDESIIKDRRGGTDMNGETTQARPTLVVDKLDQPVTSIVNEARRSRLALLVKPKGQGANNETAEVLQGLIRAIEVDSSAHAARMWAYDRAVKCGRGYYRIDVEQREDGDFDLDIGIKQIANQGSVYLDPFAVEPDRRDMRWAFLTGTYQKDEYEDRWGDVPELADESLSTPNDLAPDWIQDDAYRVAEYYEVETTACTIVRLGEDTYAVKPPEGYRLPPTVQPLPDDLLPLALDERSPKRSVQLRRVMLYVLNGLEILSETLWNGRFIPIIPVYGKIYNVDGDWSYQGVITKAKDAQRLYNVTVSSAVESALSMAKSPFIAAYDQIARFKQMWDNMNIKSYPALYYDPVHIQGTLLPQPSRIDNEPRLMGHAMLLQQADGDIKATTGRWEASLGQLNPSDRSGKAIQKLQQQAELGSSNFLDQFAAISMFYEGTVLLDLIPTIYDRPGRVARILGEEQDATEREVVLNKPFQTTPNGPKPVEGPPPPPDGSRGLMGRMADGLRKMVGAPLPPKVEHYDLSVGQYMVVPSVGPSSQTQKEDNLALLQGILEAVPDVAPSILDIMVENMEGPMARKLATRLKAMNPNLPKENDAELPPEAQAVIMQLQQQLQQQGQALQEAQQAVATNQAKQQSSIEVAKLKTQADLLIRRMELQARMGELRAKITSEAELARFDAAMQLALQNDQQQFDLEMAAMNQAAAADAAEATRAHDRDRDDHAEGAARRADYRKTALAPPPRKM